MADYWPTADQDPDAAPTVVEFANIWRPKPKVVYSRTLARVGWNATIARRVDPGEVMALKAQPGGDLVLGGAQLGAEFVRLGLVDEYRLYIHPVMIGRSHPMLRPFDALIPLRLVETRTFGTGVVMLHYESRGDGGRADG